MISHKINPITANPKMVITNGPIGAALNPEVNIKHKAENIISFNFLHT
jgi:hypothetical protein